MFAVYKRELRAYMHNVYGWLFMAVTLLVVGFMMFTYNLGGGMPNFEYAAVACNMLKDNYPNIFIAKPV